MKYTQFTAAAAALLAAQAGAQDTCTASGVVVEPTAVEYPVYISTYVADATILNINNNINITINNAPTTIEILTTGTSTVFNTVTATTTTTAAATPSTTTIDEPIILGINAGLTRKRQSAFSGFLGSGAGVSSSCQDAVQLTLNAGQLYLASGEGQFSANTGSNTTAFSASSSVGSITTTFGLRNGFVWVNSAFTGGEAIFYVSASGSINCAFGGSAPSDGTVIGLTAILASSCSNTTSSASASGTMTSSANQTLSTSIPSSLTTSSSLSFTSSSNLTTTATSSTAAASSTSSASSTTSLSTTSVSLAFSSPTAATKKRSADGLEYTVEKRQSSGLQYVKADGTFSNNSADAAIYALVDSQLFVNGAELSTNVGTDYAIFKPLDTVGDITRTFDNSAGSLTWTNESFSINSAGIAEFAVSSGTVYAAYATIPPGATQIVLSAISATSTAASSSAAATTAAATTAAATTSASVSSASASSVASSASSVASSVLSSLSSVLSSSSSTTATSTSTSVSTGTSTATSVSVGTSTSTSTGSSTTATITSTSSNTITSVSTSTSSSTSTSTSTH